jgi:hypothetical protein
MKPEPDTVALRRCGDCGRFHAAGRCRKAAVERVIVHDVPLPPERGAHSARKPNGAAGVASRVKSRPRAAPLPEPQADVRPPTPEPPPAPPPVPSIEAQMQDVTGESILQELVTTRGLTSRFHRAVAAKASSALARNSPRDAMAWLELLPPAGRVDASGRTVSADQARDHLWQLFLNAQAADQIEERKAIDKLREENASLRARLGEAPPQVEPPVNLSVSDKSKPITPSLGDIVPWSERTDRPPDPPLREPKPPVVIDATPVPTWDDTPGGKAYHEWIARNPDWDVLCW